jgi:hypothetical protein
MECLPRFMLFLSCVVLLMCSGGDLEAAAVVGCVPAGGRAGGHRRGGRRRKTGDLQGTSSENECVQREEGRFVYFYALLQIHTSPLQSMWSDVMVVCVHSYILTHPLTSSRLLSPSSPLPSPSCVLGAAWCGVGQECGGQGRASTVPHGIGQDTRGPVWPIVGFAPHSLPQRTRRLLRPGNTSTRVGYRIYIGIQNVYTFNRTISVTCVGFDFNLAASFCITGAAAVCEGDGALPEPERGGESHREQGAHHQVGPRGHGRQRGGYVAPSTSSRGHRLISHHLLLSRGTLVSHLSVLR